MSRFAQFMAWLRRQLYETPPEVMREPDPMAVYREKRAELRRAYQRSQLDDVRRLTVECSELKREIDGR